MSINGSYIARTICSLYQYVKCSKWLPNILYSSCILNSLLQYIMKVFIYLFTYLFIWELEQGGGRKISIIYGFPPPMSATAGAVLKTPKAGTWTQSRTPTWLKGTPWLLESACAGSYHQQPELEVGFRSSDVGCRCSNWILNGQATYPPHGGVLNG